METQTQKVRCLCSIREDVRRQKSLVGLVQLVGMYESVLSHRDGESAIKCVRSLREIVLFGGIPDGLDKTVAGMASTPIVGVTEGMRSFSLRCKIWKQLLGFSDVDMEKYNFLVEV